MKKLIFIFFMIIPFLIVSACSSAQETNDGRIQIYTTVYPLQYFAERIGGEHVNVQTVYPPGTDEHTFDPSQKDMMKIADSDLFFYIGYGLEGFATRAESALANQNVKMFAIGEELEIGHEAHHEESIEDDGHNHGDVDPHFWIDPVYAQQLAEQILIKLTYSFPEQKDEFQQNYEGLIEELEQLNEKFADMTKSAKRKQFIVAHAAYGYWEHRYGLEQIAISGISSSQEPSQRKLQEIVDTIRENEIPYLLVEQNITSRLADVIQQETDTEILYIHNLSVLTDADIENEETYFTLMERNIEVLERALNE